MKALIGISALLGVLASGPAYASAALPTYDGDMSFPAIHGPSDPEEYSWEVILTEGQYLESVDGQTAEVYYENGHPAFGITAEPAHDADGTTVPTSLGVSEGDVITLTVHHRAGNPAAGGAPFDYPVVAGEGWEGGFQTEIVTGPPDEQELREERERIAREEAEATRSAAEAPPPATCRVPGLAGRSLGGSRRLLVGAGCRLGRVRRASVSGARAGKVLSQRPRPGTVLAPGSRVSVKLG